MCHHAKFHQNRPNNFGAIAILAGSAKLPTGLYILLALFFQIFFTFLVTRQIGRANVHRHTKLQQNRSRVPEISHLTILTVRHLWFLKV